MIVWVLILFISLFFYLKKSSNYWKVRKVSGPCPCPIFGNIKESVFRRKNITVIYAEIYNMFPQEKVVGMYTMTSPVLLIRDLDIAKQILVKDFDCFSERGILHSGENLAENLFHSDKRTWAELKGKMSPYFTNKNLKNSFEAISECGDKCVDFIEKLNNNMPEQELNNIFRKFGIHAVLASLFDLNIDVYNNDTFHFFEKLDKSILNKSFYTELRALLPNIMKMTKINLFGETVVKFCNDIVKQIDSNRKGFTRKNIVGMLLDSRTEIESSGKIKDKEKYDLYLSENKNVINKFEVTNDMIASQVFILYATGYESTNLTLSYALYNIAANIDVQNKLIKEIDTVLTQNNGTLTYEVVNEMNYMDKVFHETIRLYPIASTIQRVATKDYTVPNTDIRIPKGLTVLVPQYAIHRDKTYYTDPLKFDPERFNSENLRTRDTSVFFPFGLGPRTCIGNRLTKLLFKVAMVKVLSKFMVRPSEKTKQVELDPNRTMLAAKGGIHIKFFLRK